MAPVTCPLCCNESFSTHSELQAHLVEIQNNLSCPTCRKSFPILADFIQHLDECTEKDSEVVMKREVCDNVDSQMETDDSDKLEAKPSPTSDAVEETADKNEDEGQYFCEMCSMHFFDIEEHLEMYHQGQEVLLEEEEDLPAAAPAREDKMDEDIFYIINSPNDGTEDEEEAAEASKKSPPEVHQEIKDKDGRPYTRKFVKIDKFWLNESQELKKPLVLKYQTDDTNVRPITDEEAAQIDDKNTIIEISQCTDCNQIFPVLDMFKSHKCTGGEADNDQSKAADKGKGRRKRPRVSKQANTGAPHICGVCSTEFTTSKSLGLHRRMHDPVKTRDVEPPVDTDTETQETRIRQMFICNVCNKTYDKQYEDAHMASHLPSSEFNCEVCNRKFYTQINLEMHMKAHSNNKKFTCSYCKKPFVTYEALNDHLANQCTKRAYACQFCGRRFTRPHEKVKHERIHTGEKPHVCDICGKAFRVSYCLTLHLRTHSGARPYECKQCGSRFKSHSVFNHHQMTHSDVRAYQCPYCPKAFKTSVQLAGHKNSHIKPFTCTICNRPFASLYAVRAHMETHSTRNNLKYECWICGALYSRAFALKDHIKQHHNQSDVDENPKAVVLSVDEEIDATNSILAKEDDLILGLEGNSPNVEVVEQEAE